MKSTFVRLTGIGLLALITSCGGSARVTTGAGSSETSADVESRDGPPVQFDEPFGPDGELVQDLTDVALPFTPALPKDPPPVEVWAANGDEDPEDYEQFVAVYDDRQLGRFNIREAATTLSPEEHGRVTTSSPHVNDAPRQTAPSGDIAELRTVGTREVFAVENARVVGVSWVEGGVHVSVDGPPDRFTLANAVKIAAQIGPIS